MRRRDFLRTGGLGLVGAHLVGCGPRGRPGRPSPALSLAPVRASWERVIRTTVGLRPYRHSGFVVRAERLGDKLLVHNYGHGGRRNVPLMGYGAPGRRPGTGAGGAPGGGPGMRGGRTYVGAATPAPRVPGDHLRQDGAARYDVQHVLRPMDAHVGPGVRGGPDHCLGGTLQARRTSGLLPTPANGGGPVRSVVDRHVRTSEPGTGSGPGRAYGDGAPAPSPPGSLTRLGRARTRRASVPVELRSAEIQPPNRASRLPGRSGRRFRHPRRQDRDQGVP